MVHVALGVDLRDVSTRLSVIIGGRSTPTPASIVTWEASAVCASLCQELCCQFESLPWRRSDLRRASYDDR